MGGVAGLAVFFPNFSALLLLAHLLIILTLGAMAMLGLRRFRKLAETASTSGPKVSIIVPVKDEQDTVKDALESLIGLDYGNREILVVLGPSKDGTPGILEDFRTRVRIIDEPPKPEGWVGKSWACHQGFLQSSGDVLLFTDGDVIHAKQSLSSAISHLEKESVDLLSPWPRLLPRTVSERLIVPLWDFMIIGVGLSLGTKSTPRGRMLPGANGQYIMVTRAAYVSLGGHEAVKGEVLEDVALGRRAVEQGLYVQNLDADGLLRAKLSSSFRETWQGSSRAAAALATSIPVLAAGLLFLFIYFVLPFLLLVLGLALQWRSIFLIGLLESIAVYSALAPFQRRAMSSKYVVLALISALLVATTAVIGFVRFRGTGIVWKGSSYKLNTKGSSSL